MARDLFDIEGHPEYAKVLSQYAGAVVLAQLLAPKTRDPGFNLELQLREYAYHDNPEIRQQYKHVPPYLRDLLWKSSILYTDRPSCYIQLAFELLQETHHEVLFLVLNYDDLLEKALGQVRPSGLRYQNIDDYVAQGRPAKVVKLHGSINWFRIVGNESGNWHSDVNGLDIFKKPDEKDISVKNLEMVKNVVENRTTLYPILTAPLAGKGLTEAVCPDSHVAVAQEFLASCNKFLIIGSSGLDEDLLTLLSEAVDARGPAPYVHLVNKGEEATEQSFRHFVDAVSAFQPADVHRFDKGFRKYVSSSSVQLFARKNV